MRGERRPVPGDAGRGVAVRDRRPLLHVARQGPVVALAVQAAVVERAAYLVIARRTLDPPGQRCRRPGEDGAGQAARLLVRVGRVEVLVVAHVLQEDGYDVVL